MRTRARRVSESIPARPADVWTPSSLAGYDDALLMDTHAWIWFLEGDSSRWARETKALLERSAEKSRLYVCDISFWEVALNASKSKLQLSVDVTVWLQRAESAPDVLSRPITRAVLLQSTRMAEGAPPDPVDRMLIAMAQLESVPLVTADRHIIEYARKYRNTPVVDVRP